MSADNKTSLLPLLVIPAIISAALTYFIGKSVLFSPIDPSDNAQRSFIVKAGENWRTLAEKLEAEQLVKNSSSIRLLMMFNDQVKDQGLKPGEYSLRRSYTPKRILEAFISQEIVFHDVLIKEGYTVWDVAQVIASSGLVSYSEAEAAVKSQKLMQSYGIDGDSLEGYLYPATYRFTRPISAEEMVDRMIKKGQKIRTEGMYIQAGMLGLSFQQVLTLASIVQKEAGSVSEMPLIASVFLNRLKEGMPLQSDPTTVYHIPNFKGKITRENLREPSAWNTYLNTGLPPTPIANPGLDAILAVLNAENTDYLYFVSKKDGSHYFSHTYGQHRKAVNYYLKNQGTEPPYIEALIENPDQ